MISVIRKELLSLVVGEALSLSFIFWVLKQVPRAPNAYPLAMAMIEYGFYGWLWFGILSFTVVFMFAAAICRIRVIYSLAYRYSQFCILSANASIVMSLFLSSTLKWNALFVNAEWNKNINNYCIMILIAGSAIALIAYFVYSVLLFFPIKKVSECESEHRGPVDADACRN
ncbi:MAG: hypothetical protein H8D56_07440 [Planctomycetes bacterium]|nr:hypothetical protein [Planctomycetota bacterium]